MFENLSWGSQDGELVFELYGVYRPGGSALNSGQVGSTRAAQYIEGKPLQWEIDRKKSSILA